MQFNKFIRLMITEESNRFQQKIFNIKVKEIMESLIHLQLNQLFQKTLWAFQLVKTQFGKMCNQKE